MSRPASACCLQVGCQIPVVVFMWAYHNQVECFRVSHAVGEEVPGGMNLEFVYEYAAKFPSFLLADGGVFDDLPDLLIQNLFFLFPESTNSLLECA